MNVTQRKKQATRVVCPVARLLSAERAALGESGLATGGLAEDGRASLADDNGLGVREDGGDGEAAGALDVHEEGAGRGHKGLRSRSSQQGRGMVFVMGIVLLSYLELVLLGLSGRRRVQKVNGENL